MINSDYTFISRLVSNSNTVRDQLDQTNEQVASGLISDTYSGLGNQARTSLSLAPAIAHQTAWSQNIDAAQGRLDVTQSAMTSISSIASQILRVDRHLQCKRSVERSVLGRAGQERAAAGRRPVEHEIWRHLCFRWAGCEQPAGPEHGPDRHEHRCSQREWIGAVLEHDRNGRTDDPGWERAVGSSRSSRQSEYADHLGGPDDRVVYAGHVDCTGQACRVGDVQHPQCRCHCSTWLSVEFDLCDGDGDRFAG